MIHHQSYQLHLRLEQDITLSVGKLGLFHFPSGEYIYTGSARRNMAARLARHLRKDKVLRWHIDYLTSQDVIHIHHISTHQQEECILNQATLGEIIVKGFGASDCQQGCGSHLRYLGPLQR